MEAPKNRKKKWLWIAGILFTLVIACIAVDFFAHKIIKDIVRNALCEKLGSDKGRIIRYSDIEIDFHKRTVNLSDFYFSSDSTQSSDKNIFNLSIPTLKISDIQIFRVLLKRDLDIRSIELVSPQLNILLGKTEYEEKKEEPTFIRNIEDSKEIICFIAALNIENMKVIGGNVSIKSTEDHLNASANNIKVSLHNLQYHLEDSSFSYNDSIYELSLGNIKITHPDSLYRTEIGLLQAKNANGLILNNLHFYCTAPKARLTKLLGNRPGTWVDMYIDEIRTDACNVLQKLSKDEIKFDLLSIKGNCLVLFKDNRPVEERILRMPQEALLKISKKILIRRIDAIFPHFVYQLYDRKERYSQISLNQIRLDAKNFTNQKKQIVETKLSGKIGKKGKYDIAFVFHLDSNGTFSSRANIQDCEASIFNAFSLPLVGVEIKSGIIDSMFTNFAGNKLETKGEMTLCYHNIQARVLKTKTPYPKLAKYSGAVNFFAPMLIPKANPKKAGSMPRTVVIEHKRNSHRPFGNYVVMTLLDGVENTLLPVL